MIKSAKVWEISEVVVARGAEGAFDYANQRAREVWLRLKSPQAILDGLERGEPVDELALLAAQDGIKGRLKDGPELGAYQVRYLMWATRLDQGQGELHSSEAKGVVSTRHAVIECERLSAIPRHPDAFADERCASETRARFEAVDIAMLVGAAQKGSESSRL